MSPNQDKTDRSCPRSGFLKVKAILVSWGGAIISKERKGGGFNFKILVNFLILKLTQDFIFLSCKRRAKKKKV